MRGHWASSGRESETIFRAWSSCYHEPLPNMSIFYTQIEASICLPLKGHFNTELMRHLPGALAPSGLLGAAHIWRGETRWTFTGPLTLSSHSECQAGC